MISWIQKRRNFWYSSHGNRSLFKSDWTMAPLFPLFISIHCCSQLFCLCLLFCMKSRNGKSLLWQLNICTLHLVYQTNKQPDVTWEYYQSFNKRVWSLTAKHSVLQHFAREWLKIQHSIKRNLSNKKRWTTKNRKEFSLRNKVVCGAFHTYTLRRTTFLQQQVALLWRQSNKKKSKLFLLTMTNKKISSQQAWHIIIEVEVEVGRWLNQQHKCI